MRALARRQEVDRGEPDDEGKGRHHFEIDQRPDGDASNSPGFSDGGDAMHHGAENDEADKHRDQPDEQLAQSGHEVRALRPEMADDGAEDHAGEDLHRHVLVEGRARLRGSTLGCIRHIHGLLRRFLLLALGLPVMPRPACCGKPGGK